MLKLSREAVGLRETDCDEEIIDHIRGGRTELYDVLVRRHASRLFRVACSILRDESEAEDVVQEACVRGYLHLDQFAGRAQFATWLTRILVRDAMARRQWHVRWNGWNGSVDQQPCTEATAQEWNPERQTINRELRTALATAIKKLPANYQTVFFLRAICGNSTRDVAARLGISEHAVKVQLHRARVRLRRELTGFMHPSVVPYSHGYC